jgi:hypothetical protein
VREQRVALEDGVGGALEGRQAGHVGAVEQHGALGRVLEAGDHAQGRRLAAAGGAEQREELAALYVEIERVDRRDVPEALRDALKPDARGALSVHRDAHASGIAEGTTSGITVENQLRQLDEWSNDGAYRFTALALVSHH